MPGNVVLVVGNCQRGRAWRSSALKAANAAQGADPPQQVGGQHGMPPAVRRASSIGG
jgi:hypothetical protein